MHIIPVLPIHFAKIQFVGQNHESTYNVSSLAHELLGGVRPDSRNREHPVDVLVLDAGSPLLQCFKQVVFEIANDFTKNLLGRHLSPTVIFYLYFTVDL